MTVRSLIKRLFELAGLDVRRAAGPRTIRRELQAYLDSRVPWSPGYLHYREQTIRGVLDSPDLLSRFRTHDPLPAELGVGVDERTVEYPWYFAHCSPAPGPRLDAGSTLNHRFLVTRPEFHPSDWTFLTLAPEAECHWTLGASYMFADLRSLPFRDDYFVEIACLSTIEHVGLDNEGYTGKAVSAESRRLDFLTALDELRRVLRPGGRLLLTVPFGRYQNFGWSQQFDAALLDQLTDRFAPTKADFTFFRYSADGWRLASRAECADAEYARYALSLHRPPSERLDARSDADGAAAARAVACAILEKPR
jgi:SAM-dependent methyltransferase